MLLALLVGCGTVGAEDTAPVDFCTLVTAQGEWSGRLVKVEGAARSNFEESSFTPSQCDLYYPLWLEVPDPGETVPDRLPPGTRVIYGMTGEELQGEAYRDKSKLPWQVAVAPPAVRVVPNKKWHRFNRLRRKWGCSTAATLIGRLDYLPGGGFIFEDEKGRILSGLSGYGHEDQYNMRLVVAEVVEVGKRTCKK